MKVAIIGGGAAGLFCAANITSHDVTLFEATSSCGNKLLLTGGGRCNYTNNATNFLDGVVNGSKFAISCFSSFNQKNLIYWFEERGLKTTFEASRAFPKTEKSASVLNLLLLECKKNNAKICYDSKIKDIQLRGEKFVINKQQFDAVVVATGGKTFAKTGSDGSGNKLLSNLGIKTNEYAPKLGPIYATETKAFQGISAEVELKLVKGENIIAKTKGPIVFTHFGISGPAALDSSGLSTSNPSEVVVNFLPNKTENDIISDIEQNKHSKILVKNFLARFVAKSIADKIDVACGVKNKRVCDLTNKNISDIVRKLKEYRFPFVRFGGFNESWVSSGGVDLSEINPKTMEVKSIKNLFVIGEQLDMFGLCGGYNLQLAFSSAMAAAKCLEGKK